MHERHEQLLGSGGSVAIATTAPATPALTADRLTAARGSARGGAADSASPGAAFMRVSRSPWSRSVVASPIAGAWDGAAGA